MGSKHFLNHNGGAFFFSTGVQASSALVCEPDNSHGGLCRCHGGICSSSGGGSDGNCVFVLFLFCLRHVRSQPSCVTSCCRWLIKLRHLRRHRRRKLGFLQWFSEAPSFLVFPVAWIQIVYVFFIFHTQQTFKPPRCFPHIFL